MGQHIKKLLSNIDYKKFTIQMLFYIVGNIILTLGVTIMMSSGTGSSGHDTMNYAISSRFGIRLSYAVYGTAVVLVLIAALVRRSFPRVSAFVTAFFVGIFLEMWQPLLGVINPPNYFVRVLLVVVGAIIFALGVSVYMAPNWATAPPDEIVSAISDVSGVKFGLIKILFDIACCIVAYFLGGTVGIGVIIPAFLVGPLVDMFNKWTKRICPTTFFKTATEN